MLVLLLESHGGIVTRETLRQKLWPKGTHVDFDGGLNVILKKLRGVLDDNADNPRFIETVPRQGYRFIAPVIASVAGGAIGDTVAVPPEAERLAGAASTQSPHAELKGGPADRTLLLLSLCSAAIILIAAAWIFRGRFTVLFNRPSLSQSAQAAPITVRKSIAVLGFHNVSGRPSDAWLSTGLSEMLSTELAGGEKMRLVPGQDVANLWVSEPWSQTDTLNQETTARIGTALNSDLLVFGSYTTTGPPNRQQIRLDVRLQDSRYGEILSEIAEVGTTQDLFRVVSRVGARLRDRLGIPGLAERDQAGVLASLPADADAARFYALGLERLRQFDALAAKNLLEQATQADPKFPLARAMLARAWSALGYEQNRRQEIKAALDLSAELPRAERLLIEGDYQEALGNHDKAASVYSVLWQLFPDNVDYGLELAAIQASGARDSEARATLEQLRKLPSAASDDPRIDLTAARLTRDEVAALELVRKAISKALSADKKLIAAQARKQQCVIMIYGGRQDQAAPVCEDAYNAFRGAGNSLGAADSLRLMGDLQGGQGHTQQALLTYDRVLAMLRKLREQEKTGAVLNNMAVIYLNEAKLGRAEKIFREALANFREAGDKHNELTALGNMADVQFLRGNLPSAGRLYQQGLEQAASLEVSDSGYLLVRMSDLQLTQGLPKEAMQNAKRALDAMRPGEGHYRERSAAMVSLAEALQATSDLPGARKQFEEALALRQKLGQSDLVEEAQLALAELSLAEGHPEKVEALIAPILPDLEKEKSDPASAGAYITLSRADRALGKIAEADAAIKHAAKFAASTPDPAIKLPLEIEHARVTTAKASSGRTASVAEARRELSSTVSIARTLGYYRIELEARQALSELASQANSPQARTQLIAVIAEARDRGLELAARQAETLLAQAKPPATSNKSAK